MKLEISLDRLPPGFADTLDDPPAEPATPLPAATTVLVRDAQDGPEALLMRRTRRSGFVPGAWVFPGGRVDGADGSDGVLHRIRGLDPDPVPAARFWAAAIRELFEETGVLLGRSAGAWVAAASSDPDVETRRRALMDDTIDLAAVATALSAELDATRMVHIGNWVTPVVEPRRYDTHFFAVEIPPGTEATIDPREMTGAVWLRPADALERFDRGELPMVFPTVETLAGLRAFASVEELLSTLRDRPVRRIVPRLVRTETGVAITTDE